MTYRPLGDSGLMVSAVGIGCNAFGRRVELDGVRGIVDAAEDTGSRSSTRPTPTAIGAERGDDRRRPRGPARPVRGGYEVRQRHARHQRPRPRRPWRAALRPASGRGVAEAAAHRPHRPLPVPLPGRRSRPIEETLSVLTDLVREGKVRYVGVLQRRRRGRSPTADWTARTSGFERFVSVQNRYSLLDRAHRGGGRARGRALRARRTALLPARVRPAHRQVPPRRRRRRTGHARGPAPRPGSRTPTGTGSRPSRSTPKRATSRSSTSRSPVSPRSRPSPASSPAPRRVTRCGPTPRRSAGSRPPTTSPSWTRSPRAELGV